MKPSTQIKPHLDLGITRVRRLLGAIVFFAGTCGSITPTLANTDADLLEPERAFQLSGRQTDSKTVELQYKIAGGHYLYRAKFKFALEPATDARLGNAQISKGKMKQDPTFGWVETYRDSVRILLPIANLGKSASSAGVRPLRLKVTSQGCADAGVCYPPLHQYLTFEPNSLATVLPDGLPTFGGSKPPLAATTLRSLSETLRKPAQP